MEADRTICEIDSEGYCFIPFGIWSEDHVVELFHENEIAKYCVQKNNVYLRSAEYKNDYLGRTHVSFSEFEKKFSHAIIPEKDALFYINQ